MNGQELGMPPEPDFEADWDAWVAWEGRQVAVFKERIYEGFLVASEIGGYWLWDSDHGIDEIIFHATNDRVRQLIRDQHYQPDENRYKPLAGSELSSIRYDAERCIQALADEGRIVPFFRSGWPGYARPGHEAWAARTTDPDRRRAGPIPPRMRSAVWDKSDGRCWYCGDRLNPFVNFSIDHVVPRAAGGTNDLFNLVPCCSTCNSAKRHRSVEEFRGDMPGRIFFFEHEGLG